MDTSTNTSTSTSTSTSNNNTSTNQSTRQSTIIHKPCVNSRQHLKSFCQDIDRLTNGLNHPVIVDQLTQLDASIIQSTLPRLDDYTALIDAFRVSCQSLNQELVGIQNHTIDQSTCFLDRVHRFDEYVTNVETCLSELEKRIGQAEDAYVSHSALSTAGLVKIFSAASTNVRVSTEPIEIVSSADYINQPINQSANMVA